MAIDFFGVTLSGRIRQFPKGITGKSRVIELWTEPQESQNSDLNALAFVSQITVDHKFGDNAIIALVLTPPYEDGLALLQSDIIRFGTGRLEIEFGYSTGTSTGPGATTFKQLPFSGFLQKPDVSIGNDITITLNAHGVGYQMNVIGGTESKAFPKGTTWAQAVESTLKKYIQEDGSSTSLSIKNLYSSIPEQKKNRTTGDAFFREPAALTGKFKPGAKAPSGVITKGPRNDWWFVRETVESFGYDLVIYGNEVTIIDKTAYLTTSLGRESATRKHFMLRGNVDPTRNMFPILSFTSSSDGAWLAPGVGKLQLIDWPDNKKKKEEPESAEVSANTVENSAGGDGGKVGKNVPVDNDADLSVAGDVIQAGANFPGNPSYERYVRLAEAHWKDLQMSKGIVGEIASMGVPDLRPGEKVQVSGFEKFGANADPERALFNGMYGVQTVRHQVGVGGWATSFTGTIGAFHKDAMLARVKAKKTSVAKNEELSARPGGNRTIRLPIKENF